jgi:membrane associated rhomboid family serine protease
MRRWIPTLIAANVAVYILQQLYPGITDAFVWWPAGALSRPWTAFTYMFLHGGIWHIVFNMVALWIFGPRVEARIGGNKFLGLYLVSGLAGAALCFLQPNVAVVGASGAIFGVSLAYARYWPRDQVYLYGVIPVSTRMMVIIYAILSVGGAIAPAALSFMGNVAHLGHLGGFLGGWLYCLWLERFTGARSFRAMAEGRRPAPVVAIPIGPTVEERAALERWARIPAEQLHPVNREELERIRDKLAATGPRSLSHGEIEFLERFSGLGG